jgi:hypothetical protein
MEEITPSNFLAFDPLALHLQFSTDCVAQVDIEAHQAAVSSFGFEGRVGRIDAETQLLVLLGHCVTGGQTDGECGKGQPCFFHRSVLKTKLSVGNTRRLATGKSQTANRQQFPNQTNERAF